MNDLMKRLSFQVEAGWEFNLHDGWSGWAFCFNSSLIRGYRLKKCFWPHAWLRVLGFWVGIGFMYVSTEKIDG